MIVVIVKFQHLWNKKVVVYNLLSNEIIVLVDEYKNANIYEIEFNSVDLPRRIYFYNIISGYYSATKKMVLIK